MIGKVVRSIAQFAIIDAKIYISLFREAMDLCCKNVIPNDDCSKITLFRNYTGRIAKAATLRA